MKILNLYAGIGGNRKLWEDVEVTAVEFNPEIAAIYQEYFPDDTVIVADAHEYLLAHYKEFDFIWSSPPCQTHSRARFWGSKGGTCEVKYPDAKLWQEIIFLKNFATCPYVVENVIPYYPVFIAPVIELERHLFWSNWQIKPIPLNNVFRDHQRITGKTILYDFNISNTVLPNKTQILRNLVSPEIGLAILDQVRGIKRKSKLKQISLLEDL